MLAFELAARLQQELEALDWVTAEQKVTRPGPADHDACGWSDGTLARFEIRAGRLAGWTLRACGAAAARRHLAATPPEWTAFAQRNAELAARLSKSTLARTYGASPARPLLRDGAGAAGGSRPRSGA